MIQQIPRALVELRRLHRVAAMSTDEILFLQWFRFRQIVRHAFANSRFYREQWRRAGLEPDDVRTRDDLSLIPLTSRDDLGDQGNLVIDSVDSQRLESSESSGTTSQWTKSYFDQEAWLMGKYLLKARARLLCGMRPWDRTAIFHFNEVAPISASERLLRQRRYSIVQPCEEILPSLMSFSPTVLYGFPSYLSQLAATAAGDLRPRLIFTSGEMLDAVQIEDLKSSFGAQVLDIYGCTEFKEISWQCTHARSYHINADWLLLETVDSSGNPTSRDGRLVITSLYNRAMPLIRYEVGDTGMLNDRACPCGLGLPVMSPIEGRTDDYLLAGDGSRISPMSARSAIDRVPGVRRYQIVQQRSGAVVVRVVPRDLVTFVQSQDVRVSLSAVLMRPDVEVVIEEAIPREPNGKFRYVVSNV